MKKISPLWNSLLSKSRIVPSFRVHSRLYSLSDATESSSDSSSTPAYQKKQGIKRFWKTVGIDDEGYSILLDNRILKTPKGSKILTNSKTLAVLVASEWDRLKSIISLTDRNALPLTSIISRSIDELSYDSDGRQQVLDNLSRYFDTDSVLYREDHPASLVDMQKEVWDPIVDWTNNTFGVGVSTSGGFSACKHDVGTRDKLLNYVSLNYDALQLAGFEQAVMTSKSFLIGLGLMERYLTVEQAALAARVESVAQSKIWGQVDDAHDLDEQDMKRQLGAASCVLVARQ